MPACLRRIVPIALLLLACVIAGNGRAAESFACGPDVAGSPATGGVPQGVGNPINLITGNKHQRETDMAALAGALVEADGTVRELEEGGLAGALLPSQYGDPLAAAAHEALRFDRLCCANRAAMRIGSSLGRLGA